MAIPSINRPRRDWQRLADTVRSRRAELGVTQDQACELSRGTISRPTWSKLESPPDTPRSAMATRSLNAAARVLGWTYDSCERVLLGQEPIVRRSDEAELSFQVWSTEQQQRSLVLAQEEAEPRLAEIEARMSSLELALQQLAGAVREALPGTGSRSTTSRSARPRRRGGQEKN